MENNHSLRPKTLLLDFFRSTLVLEQLVWDSREMETAVPLDITAIRAACEHYGVARLRVFGSILTDQFEPKSSDVDFLVLFLPNREDLFSDYFDLKFELEKILGLGVDLVMERSVRNPFFKATAFGKAQDIYAI